MRSLKGQTLVVVVFGVIGVALVSFMIFLLLVAGTGTLSTETGAEVQHQFANIKLRSALATTMEGQMWRAGSIPEGKYGGRTAGQVIALYLSFPEKDFISGGNPIPPSEVEEDIESYLRYRMESYFERDVEPVGYSVRLFRADENSPRMEVSNYDPQPSDTTASVQVALSDGSVGGIFLSTNATDSLYSLDRRLDDLPEVNSP